MGKSDSGNGKRRVLFGCECGWGGFCGVTNPMADGRWQLIEGQVEIDRVVQVPAILSLGADDNVLRYTEYTEDCTISEVRY